MLLPFKWKIFGFALILSGIVLALLFIIIDLRIEFPVLAVFSSYMETKFFTSFKTNFADELIMLLFIIGFASASFSREKNESEQVEKLRITALKRTAVLNTAFLAFSVLFIYGGGFMAVLVINMFMPFIIYLILFNTLIRRNRKTNIR